MYRFFQTHGKKLMAVFSAFLMIAFALPSASKYAGSHDTVVGRLGSDGEKIRSSDLYDAKRSWEILKTIPRSDGQGTQATRLPREIGAAIEQRPLLFLLLQKEAQRMGVAVSKDTLETTLVNTPGYSTADDEKRIAWQHAVAELELVLAGFQRGASTIKVTAPMSKRELAAIRQEINLNVVAFDAKSYADKVAAPTLDQLKTQFDKYADVIKGNTSPQNPFGFGYKYPDRLKLQYIAVPREQVRKAVEASRTPYEWRVEAQKYYIQHENEFAFVSSTTQPLRGSAAASQASGGSTRPIMQPFPAVADRITNQLIDAETSRRANAILERISFVLASDWVAYHNTPAGATTAPSATLKVPYDSFEYLQKLAASIQSEFKVQPTVVSLAEKWLGGDDLKSVPGLGAAMAQLDVGEVPAPLYLMARTSAFATPDHRDDSGMLHVLEPTRPLKDSIQTMYIARLGAAEPSHRPAVLAEVEPLVKADAITAKAYELAKADANKLLDVARQKGLADAAATAGGAGAKVVSVGPLSKHVDQSVTPLNLPAGPSANQLIGACFDLLGIPTSRPSGKPVALVELRREGRAFVAELGDVQAKWTPRSLLLEQAQLESMMTEQMTEGFARSWFNYPSVVARTNFVPDTSLKEAEVPTAPPPPQAPIF